MFLNRRFLLPGSAIAVLCAGVAGCAGVPDSLAVVENVVSPYRMDMVQGNVVTREQVAQLAPGMTRTQVKDVMGTPLLSSVFHAERWDYIFTFARQGAKPQARRVSVFFTADVMDRVEADDLPTEAEFAATLKTKEPVEDLPALEASPEALREFPAPAAPAPAAPVPTVSAAYPPLEPAAQ